MCEDFSFPKKLHKMLALKRWAFFSSTSENQFESYPTIQLYGLMLPPFHQGTPFDVSGSRERGIGENGRTI